MPESPEIVPAAPTAVFSLVHPLDEFYAQAGQPLPPLNQIDGQAMPEPYRTILVHQNDMTPTLERFHQKRIHLQVLGRRRVEETYFREVILRLDGNNQAVEFGASRVNLSRLPAAARAQILEERVPIGHILADHNIPHASRPRAYLRVASDRLINEVLGLTGAQVLYGRRNSILDPQGHSLAEVVEILPPAFSRPEHTKGAS